MAKATYASFIGGLSVSDREGGDNQFYIGRAVEVYERPGHMRPGWDKSEITLTGITAGNNVRETVIDSDVAYLFTDDAKAYSISSVLTDLLNANVDGASNPSVAITNMSGDMKGIVYSALYGGVLRKSIFVAYNSAGEIAVVNAGQASPYSAGNIDKTFLATRLSASALDNNGNRDVIEYAGFLMFTDGRYIDKYDGSVGNYGTWTPAAFDLGVGWVADCLFTTGNYLGICASKNKNASYISECRVYIIDLSSSTQAVKIIPINNLNSIYGAKNKDGVIYLCGDGRSDYNLVGVLDISNESFREILPLSIESSGLTDLNNPARIGTGSKNTIDVMKNKLIFGLDNNPKSSNLQADIMAIDVNEVVTMPHSLAITISSGSYIISLKTASDTKLYVASGGHFYSLSRGTFSLANYAALYRETEQKMSINYIKVYFRPLVSGDACTVSLDTNYGTSNAIKQDGGVVSFAIDGAITSKKFDLGGIECYSFRPNISWTAGHMTISKIVIDYDTLDE